MADRAKGILQINVGHEQILLLMVGIIQDGLDCKDVLN